MRLGAPPAKAPLPSRLAVAGGAVWAASDEVQRAKASARQRRSIMGGGWFSPESAAHCAMRALGGKCDPGQLLAQIQEPILQLDIVRCGGGAARLHVVKVLPGHLGLRLA